MKRSKILTLTGTVLAGGTLLNQSAQAGGLGLYEISSPDVGLASAGYAARAQDASTLFKNPGGMSLLEVSQFQSGVQLLYADLKFSPGASTPNTKSGGDGGNAVGALPGGSLFYVHKVTDKLAVGIGTFSYFGLAEEYDSNWVGRYYVQKGVLLGMSVMPAASFKVNDWLSVGGGLNAMFGYMDTEVAINTLGSGDGRVKVKDQEWGFGGIGGMVITPCEGTRIGVTYISEVKLDFSDKPSFSNLGPLSNLPVFQNNSALDVGVTVPQSVMVGIYQDLNEKWALMADVGWQQWSRFGKVDIGYDAANPNSLTKNLNYDDTWHGALGAIYKYSDEWRFTGGVAYDTSAVDDANRTVTLPMGEAYRVGLGTLWKMSDTIDFGAAYEFIWAGDMEVSQTSAYRGDVVGAYENVWFSFVTVNLNWRF
jgi:long-chain fatty acid transport protein